MDKSTLSAFVWCIIVVIVLSVIIASVSVFKETTNDGLNKAGKEYLDKSIVVDIPEIGTSLEKCSWAEIQKICNENLEQKYFQIGDEKTIGLSYSNGNTEVVKVVLLDFDHDRIAGTNKTASITFGFKNCLSQKAAMNNISSNESGWSYSIIYSSINSEDNYRSIYNAFPKELKNIIAPVYKQGSIGNKQEKITVSESKLFLFSEKEIFGSASLSMDGEGIQYRYYQTHSIIKKCGLDETVSDYWLRSPAKTSSENYCYITDAGSSSIDNAKQSKGITLGFCIR